MGARVLATLPALQEGIAYEERGPAVTKGRAQRRGSALSLHPRLRLPSLLPVAFHTSRHRLARCSRHRASACGGFLQRTANSASALWQTQLGKRAFNGDDFGAKALNSDFGSGARKFAEMVSGQIRCFGHSSFYRYAAS